MLIRCVTLILLIVLLPGAQSANELDAAEELAETINAYRASMGLHKINISPFLTEVAELHVQDLEENDPARNGCNLHSWSKSKRWSSCCYRPNNDKESCMWDKPREISQGRYSGNGYEIAAWSSHPMTPQYALELWKKSKGHHDIIINSGPWSAVRWRSMGVAISAHHAVVWFGEI